MRAFTAGGIAKFISSLVMYPLTTIRTRYQQTQFITDSIKPKYSSSFDIVRKIVSEEGVTGFYKGFTINLVKGFIQRGIYFYFYELAKKTLGIEHIPSKKK
jgi:hypothetical protein